MKRLLGGLVALGLAVTLSAEPAAAASKRMSEGRAGHYYLRTVCPNNHELNRFIRVIWHGRTIIPRAEVKRRLPELRRLSRRLGNSEDRVGRRLDNPPAAWPTSVGVPINIMTTATIRATTALMKMGNSGSANAWLRHLKWLNRALKDVDDPVVTIRIRLDLPPPGRGCHK